MSRFGHQELLDKALAGDVQALGSLLEKYRAYLTVLAKRDLSERIQSRIDENDIVQLTFLEAQRDFAQFRGAQIEELLAWLRNILRNNIWSTHQQHLHTQKRSAERETNHNPNESGPDLMELAPSDETSPSHRVMRNEAVVHLMSCLDDLPELQREAIRLRYSEGLSLKEIAVRMGKTEMAAAGLLKRGLQSLRDRMSSDSSDGGFPV